MLEQQLGRPSSWLVGATPDPWWVRAARTGGAAFLFPVVCARKPQVLVSQFPFAPVAWRRFIAFARRRGDSCGANRAMKLSDLITKELVEVPLQAADKWQAIAAIARLPARAGRYPESLVPTVEQALVVRERSMTTGMEHGIAIPHAAIDGIDDLVAVLGLNPAGIPFETLDGEPARIVIGLIIPRSKKLAHIKTLAEIAKLLSRADVRDRLLQCRDADAAVQALCEVQGAPR
ncbi:MAG: PTS sugar transporter subunit IIA [Planctomycetes bacterium]|nr:PTS sugar transporter subunit IIA [Planctomycetota bacterium]